MSARVVASERTGFRVAGSQACGQCPWRLANQGRRHPGGWYSKANLARLWGGLRRGERMTCHPTDPDNLTDGCSCHEPPPPGTKTRECAGALIVVQRELQAVNDVLAAGGSWADYRARSPKGLTREGAAAHAWALLVLDPSGLVGSSLEVGRPNLNDLAVGYPVLPAWEPR